MWERFVKNHGAVFISSIKTKKFNHAEVNGFERKFTNFAKIVGRTKKLCRTGWKVKAKIESAETIAEHMYRATVLAMVISDNKKLNTEKVLKMSLLQDLVEVITGEITTKERTKIWFENSFKI